MGDIYKLNDITQWMAVEKVSVNGKQDCYSGKSS